MLTFVLELLLTLIASYLTVSVLIPYLKRRGVIDVPNARSSHQSPTPRGGGIGVVVGIAAGIGGAWLAGIPIPGSMLLVATSLVAACGALDDFLGGLPVAIRFLVYTAAAGLLVWTQGGLTHAPLPGALAVPLGIAAAPLAIVWLVGVTNIFNFLDGIDGFAGTQALLAALALACVSGNPSILTAAAAIAGACVGFLAHNWHPARIFMGDVGSTTLGFLLAALPWQETGQARGTLVLYMGLFLWFFLSDGVYTIVKRLLRGEKIWKPHRSHLYQQLSKSGMRHDTIVIRVAAMAIVVSSVTFLAERAESVLGVWIAIGTAICLFGLYVKWSSSTNPPKRST